MGKKVYPMYMIDKIVGRQVYAGELKQYGLPYTTAGGALTERLNEGILDLMFVALERFPEIHPVSFMRNGYAYNCFQKDAFCYILHYGNKDPEIEFLPLFNDNTVEYYDYVDIKHFVDLSANPLSPELQFRIQCVKNRFLKK